MVGPRTVWWSCWFEQLWIREGVGRKLGLLVGSLVLHSRGKVLTTVLSRVSVPSSSRMYSHTHEEFGVTERESRWLWDFHRVTERESGPKSVTTMGPSQSSFPVYGLHEPVLRSTVFWADRQVGGVSGVPSLGWLFLSGAYPSSSRAEVTFGGNQFRLVCS